MSKTSKILYTITDEAPALATYSWLPIIQAYSKRAGIDVETRDISLAARILSQFNDILPEEQQFSDDLTELERLPKHLKPTSLSFPISAHLFLNSRHALKNYKKRDSTYQNIQNHQAMQKNKKSKAFMIRSKDPR